MSSSTSTNPWYRSRWTAIVLLVLFPPVGLYLMWRYQEWAPRTKGIAAVASTLWLAAVVAGISLSIVLGGGGEEGERPSGMGPQETALRELEAASERPLDTYYQNGFPRFVHADVPVQGADAVERARNFLRSYGDLYLQSNPDLALAVRDVKGPGEDGLEYVAFYQTYRGYPVYAGEIVVSLDGDRVFATIGGLLSNVVLNTFPAISPREAEDIARDDVGLPGAPIFGDTSLVVFDRSLLEDVPSDPHMAWEVSLSDQDPWRVFVDAHTGEVLFKHSLTVSDKSLDLEDANGTNSADTGCYWWTTADDWIGDEDGLDEDYLNDPQAVNAWYFYHWAYDFYLNNFGRDSYNDDGGELEVYVHSNTKGGASWVGGPNTFDCDLIQYGEGNVAWDVTVHELNHGVLSYRATSEPDYAFQPGALNESLSDTFGYLADPDCPFGEDTAGGAIRDFCDPPLHGQPDRMSEWVHLINLQDNGGVHRNNGILNKAAYLLAEGGTHPDTGVTVAGIGRPALGALYYAAEATITSGYQFIDWRNSVVSIAAQWAATGAHEFTSGTLCQVRNAFWAVELGNGDDDCDGVENIPESDDDHDGVGDMADNCLMTYNPSQTDSDGDGMGDACDPDVDGDGVPGFARCDWDSYWAHDNPSSCVDNCISVPNPDQGDVDHDGKGDVCDDDDGDGVFDDVDNCPHDWNPDQANVDSQVDNDGDACDPDSDGDGVTWPEDNCPFVANPDQANSDDDPAGDACDPCPEVTGETYACGFNCIQTVDELICHYFPIFDDSDGDTIPDACDDSFSMGRPATEQQSEPQGPAVEEQGKAQAPHKSIEADGQLMRVSLEVGPKTYQKIPLDPCPAADDTQGNAGCGPGDAWGSYTAAGTHICQDALPLGERALLVLEDMDPDVKAWVSDEVGRSVDSRYKGDTRVFRFRPQGGHRYFLHLAFGPTFEPGQLVAFTAVMTTGPAEEQTGPELAGPARPPFVAPAPLGTAAPSPTPTGTPTPQVTPTPSVTPEERATLTAVATPTPAGATPTPSAPPPTATHTAVPPPAATDTSTPAPIATATPTPTATATETPTPKPPAIPTPTRWPVVIVTPSPTLEPPR
jgi:Zn-dependent metalloprotease